MRAHRARLALAIAAASVILGIIATVVVHTVGLVAGPVSRGAGASFLKGSAMWRQYPAAALCPVPALPGTVVDVNLTDMGSMMGPVSGGMMARAGMVGPRLMPGMAMMRILLYPHLIPAGEVSLRTTNTGGLSHELVVLPLATGQLPGQRPSGPDGRVDESGSLGEVSRSCGPGKGDEQSPDYGIVPQASGWTTLSLAPGRYELICNIAGHYVAGMSAELDVTGVPS
ncbi:sulfocyanin-like copper-binding protein [Mycolicibacterium brisbanense]